MKEESKYIEIMEIISKHTGPKVRGPGGVLYDKERKFYDELYSNTKGVRK